MAYLTELLSTPTALIYVTFIIGIFVYRRFNAKSQYPQHVPWVGRDDSKYFAIARANLKSLSSGWELLKDGYEKVNEARTDKSAYFLLNLRSVFKARKSLFHP